MSHTAKCWHCNEPYNIVSVPICDECDGPLCPSCNKCHCTKPKKEIDSRSVKRPGTHPNPFYTCRKEKEMGVKAPRVPPAKDHAHLPDIERNQPRCALDVLSRNIKEFELDAITFSAKYDKTHQVTVTLFNNNI